MVIDFVTVLVAVFLAEVAKLFVEPFIKIMIKPYSDKYVEWLVKSHIFIAAKKAEIKSNIEAELKRE